MKKTPLYVMMWQALGSPLAFAWGLLIAVFAGVYLWCGLQENGLPTHRTSRVEVAIPALDETTEQAQAASDTIHADHHTPGTEETGVPGDKTPASEAASSSPFAPESTDDPANTGKTEHEAATPLSESKTPQNSEPSASKATSAPSSAASEPEGHTPTVDDTLEGTEASSARPQWRRNAYQDPLAADTKLSETSGKIRPHPASATPMSRLALVIEGLGMDAQLSERAINELPADITLAFSPYAKDLEAWILKAREAGHDVLLMLPVEPDHFAQLDPGPLTLLLGSEVSANQKRLDNFLNLGHSVMGVVSHLGQRFSQSALAVETLFDALAKPGLLMVNAQHPSMPQVLDQARRSKVPFISCDMNMDPESSSITINDHLALLEGLTRERSSALAALSLYPKTLSVVTEWLKTLPEKNIQLSRVTQHVKP